MAQSCSVTSRNMLWYYSPEQIVRPPSMKRELYWQARMRVLRQPQRWYVADFSALLWFIVFIVVTYFLLTYFLLR